MALPLRSPVFDSDGTPQGKAAVALLGNLNRNWVLYLDGLAGGGDGTTFTATAPLKLSSTNALVLQVTGPLYSTVSGELNVALSPDFVVNMSGQLAQTAVNLQLAYNFAPGQFTTAGGTGPLTINALAVNYLIAGTALFAGTATFAFVNTGNFVASAGTGFTLAANFPTTSIVNATIVSGSTKGIVATYNPGTGAGTVTSWSAGTPAVAAGYTIYAGQVQIGGPGITLADAYVNPINTVTVTSIGASIANATSGASFQVTASGATVYASSATNANFLTISAGGMIAVGPLGSTLTTLNGSINNSQLTATVANGANIQNFGYYQIDNEIIGISSGGTTTSLGIVRAQFGSTAAAHSNGASLTAFTALVTTPSLIQFIGGGQSLSVSNSQIHLAGPGGTLNISDTSIVMANSATTAQTTLTAAQWQMTLGSGLFGAATIQIGSGLTQFGLSGGTGSGYGIFNVNVNPAGIGVAITLGPNSAPTSMTILPTGIQILGNGVLGSRRTGPNAAPAFTTLADAQTWCGLLYGALNTATGHGLIN